MIKLLTKWTEHGGHPYGIMPSERLERSTRVDMQVRANFCMQLFVLVLRDLTVAKREPLAYLLRMGVNLIVGFLLSIIYLKARNHTQDQVVSVRCRPSNSLVQFLKLNNSGACVLTRPRASHDPHRSARSL